MGHFKKDKNDESVFCYGFTYLCVAYFKFSDLLTTYYNPVKSPDDCQGFFFFNDLYKQVLYQRPLFLPLYIPLHCVPVPRRYQ